MRPRRVLRPGTAAGVAERIRQRQIYRRDPVVWHADKLKGRMWSKPREIARSVVENRYTSVQGCHDFGKSYTAATLMAWWQDIHPMGEAFIVSTAPTWPQVNTILWRELRTMHKKAGLPGYITMDARWVMGGNEIVGYGRKPADHDQAAFQGIHSRYPLIVIDEACGVPEGLFDAVHALATNKNARVLAIGNPDDATSHFAEICKPDTEWNTIQVSAFDWLAEREQYPELHDVLVDEVFIEEAKKRWGEDSPVYQSKVLGQFPDVSDDALITPAMLRKAYELELPGQEAGVYGLDVARFGTDKSTMYRNRGGSIRFEWEISKKDTMETAARASATVNRHGGAVPIVIDVIGVGAGVYDKMRLDGLPVYAHNAAEAAVDQKRFVNRRAEVYWGFREAVEEGLVDLDPADLHLAAELQAHKWGIDGRGRIYLEKKDDIRKRLGHSPDRADAAVMCAIGNLPVKRKQAVKVGTEITSGLRSRRM